MMRKRNMWIWIVIAIIVLCILVTHIVDKQNIPTNATAQSLSNKKIGWGIKRDSEHNQPDVGKENQQILNQYQGMYLGNKEDKVIYLTFDEGYEAGYTSKMLDVLKDNDVKATFFITGYYFNKEQDLIKRMLDEGHIIGNHTVNHKSMPTLDDETLKKEITDLHTSVYDKFGYEMKYFRPPMGEYSQRTVYLTKNLGYKTVMWSFAYDDFHDDKQGQEEYAKQKIYDNLHNGQIMLLHAKSKDNMNILDEVIKEIKKQGYEFKSLDEFK